MEQIRSKPAFPRKATGKTWVFQERQKANQQIAGADKNIDIKTRRPRHRKAQFYISNKSIFNNFLLRLKFSFHDILSVKCKLLHGLLESVNYNRHEVGIVCFLKQQVISHPSRLFAPALWENIWCRHIFLK